MISKLDFDDLPNDLDVAVAPPSEYVDATVSLLPEGTYVLTIEDIELSRDETGKPDGRAVVLTVRVAEGDYEGRVARNLRVWTTPYRRGGVLVSALGDLIRAIDPEAAWSSLGEALEILVKAMDTKQTFRARLVWTAFDLEYYRQLGGPSMARKSPEEKELRKEATVRGMRNFRQLPDGSYYPETQGPSGNIVEARLEFGSFYRAGR